MVAEPASNGRPGSSAEKEAAIINGCAMEGIYMWALPAVVGCLAGTYIMRRRVTQLRATPLEQILLTTLQYYGAVTIGAATAMKLYEPVFERKVLERAPNSDFAHLIRSNRR